MKLEFSQPIFEKKLNIKFNQNPSSQSRVVPCGQTDGHEVITAFRNFAKVPKNDKSFPTTLLLMLLITKDSFPAMRYYFDTKDGKQSCKFISNNTGYKRRVKKTQLLNRQTVISIYVKLLSPFMSNCNPFTSNCNLHLRQTVIPIYVKQSSPFMSNCNPFTSTVISIYVEL
jgi:hypothetical protein